MNLRILTTGPALLAAIVLTVGLGTSPADAQQQRQKRVVASANSPNVSYQQGPRTRIFVTRRHWLDLGTEVRPGERKYTDYAIPPGYNIGDQLHSRSWRRQSLPEPWDLPGAAKGGYGY